MRNVTKGLVSIVLTGLTIGVVAACSADGSTDIPGDSMNTGTSQNGTDPAMDNSGNPTGSSSNTGTTDAGKGSGSTGKDSGASMGVDAGPPPPNAGDPCPAANAVFTRTCGFCGTQQAICLPNAEGGGNTVQDYSPCSGEVVDGCKPGTVSMEACGLCGTHQVICQNNCQKAAGTCTGEPAGACSPGTITNSGASCGAGLYRQQTCGTDCKLGNFSPTCGAFVNPHSIAVSGTAKGVVTVGLDMEQTTTSFALYGFASCPDTDATDILANAASDYAEVDNNTGKAVTLTAYTSPTNVGDQLSTYVWVYSGAVPPTTDNAKLACTTGVSEDCYSDPVTSTNHTLCGPDSGNFYFAALGSIAIPVGGKALVYVGNDTSMGKVNLNIRTDTLK